MKWVGVVGAKGRDEKVRRTGCRRRGTRWWLGQCSRKRKIAIGEGLWYTT